jgi:hypothetical protein
MNLGWMEILVILGGLVCVAAIVFGIAGAVYFVLKRGKDERGRRE